MKKIILLLSFYFLLSCSAQVTKSITPTAKPVEKEDVKKPKIKTGWVDNDTYKVKAIGNNEKIAKEKAKHQILKDIVSVRIMNQSRYTDIVKIKREFHEPLEKGKITSSRNVDEGVEIYFQIKEKGLRKKFEIK